MNRGVGRNLVFGLKRVIDDAPSRSSQFWGRPYLCTFVEFSQPILILYMNSVASGVRNEWGVK